jgi:hypothetical protein
MRGGRSNPSAIAPGTQRRGCTLASTSIRRTSKRPLSASSRTVETPMPIVSSISLRVASASWLPMNIAPPGSHQGVSSAAVLSRHHTTAS